MSNLDLQKSLEQYFLKIFINTYDESLFISAINDYDKCVYDRHIGGSGFTAYIATDIPLSNSYPNRMYFLGEVLIGTERDLAELIVLTEHGRPKSSRGLLFIGKRMAQPAYGL